MNYNQVPKPGFLTFKDKVEAAIASKTTEAHPNSPLGKALESAKEAQLRADHLESELTKTQAEANRKAAIIVDLESKVSAAQSRVTSLTEDLSGALANALDAFHRSHDAQSHLDEVRLSLEEASAELDRVKATLHDEQVTHRALAETTSREIEELRTQLGSASDELEIMSGALEMAKQDGLELQSGIGSLREQLSAQEARVAQLEEDLENMRCENEMLENERDDALARLSVAQGELGSTKGMLSSETRKKEILYHVASTVEEDRFKLQIQLLEKVEHLSQVQGELEATKAQATADNENYQELLANKEDRLARAEMKLFDAQYGFRQQLSDYNKRTAQGFRHRDAEIGELRGELATVRSQLGNARAERLQARNELREVKEDNEDLNKLVNQASEALQTLRDEQSVAESEFERVREGLEREVGGLRDALDAKTCEHEQARADATAFQDQVRSLQDENAALRALLAERDSALSDAQTRLAEAQDTLKAAEDNASARIIALNNEIATFQDIVADLDDALFDTNSELGDTKAALAAANNTIALLTAQLGETGTALTDVLIDSVGTPDTLDTPHGEGELDTLKDALPESDSTLVEAKAELAPLRDSTQAHEDLPFDLEDELVTSLTESELAVTQMLDELMEADGELSSRVAVLEVTGANGHEHEVATPILKATNSVSTTPARSSPFFDITNDITSTPPLSVLRKKLRSKAGKTLSEAPQNAQPSTTTTRMRSSSSAPSFIVSSLSISFSPVLESSPTFVDHSASVRFLDELMIGKKEVCEGGMVAGVDCL
ncbi:hypothetical protein NLI96_g6186 [Meripilus lineatus]|uniref:Uncharacterized protein n=1 Tax=Meripilus lineatus TaxID=2056292 RepID=A0AAD5V3D3_9APHY|nr:hypothetical protein NLI96_g6186 [Physisporinus lineatus]